MPTFSIRIIYLYDNLEISYIWIMQQLYIIIYTTFQLLLYICAQSVKFDLVPVIVLHTSLKFCKDYDLHHTTTTTKKTPT